MTVYFKDSDPPSAYDRHALMDEVYDVNDQMRQWNYQYCTELGYFQTQDFDHYLRSKYMTEEYWDEFCVSIFGQSTNT